MTAGATEFYAYIHGYPDGRPFYVGKGHGKRSHDFINNRNRHHRNIVNKHGSDRIIVNVFPCDDEKQALLIECDIIKILRDCGFHLANMTDGGQGPSGYRHTDAARNKMSVALRGRTLSLSHRLKIGRAHFGMKRTEGTRAKISAALLGRTMPKFSDECRRNMSNALRGRLVSQETRRKLSEAMRGRKYSPETLANMSASHLGRPWSEARRLACKEKQRK